MTKGWAKKLRSFLMPLKGRRVHFNEMAEHFDLITKKEKKLLYNTVADFMDRGEIKRVAESTYIYVGLPQKAELRLIIWRKIRAARTVTIDDLIEVSGAKRSYIEEILRFLMKRKIVRKNKNHTYTLIHDPVEMPKDDKKAEKLRKIRLKKKEAIAAIDQMIQAGMEARMKVAEIEE